MPPPSTALLVFSRSARSDAAAKPLSGHSVRLDQAVARQFITHTRRVAAQAGLPVFWMAEADQHGDSFGERLANTFEAVYAQGYQHVIAIGNDCPTLTAADLRRAAQMLAGQSMVLGPSTDGGVYLLGLSRSDYNRQQFLTVPWQTKAVLAGLTAWPCDEIAILATQADVDTPSELQRQLRRAHVPILLKIALLRLLSQVLSSPVPAFSARPKKTFNQALPLRAPPALNRPR